MAKRLDYNQLAPNGAKAFGSVYGYVVQSGLPGDLVERAARAVFDEKQLVDLTIAISLMNSYNRMAISFRNAPRAVLEN